VRIFPLWLLWILLTGLLFSGPNTLKKIEVRNNELRLNFSSWFDGANVHQMVLNNPSRQVIDIKNARLGSSRNLSALKADGVRSFRAAQRNNDTVRIVIETDEIYRCKGYQPMAPRTAYRIPLPKASSCRREIKVEKYSDSVSQKKPAKKAKKVSPPVKKKHLVAKKRPEPVAESEPEEKKSFFSSIFSSAGGSSGRGPKGKYTIVVDPGHGGHDSGAIGGGRYEKDLVLQIAKRTAKALKKKGFRVKMTRATDHFVKLRSRTHYANRQKADIFVSIHANAIAQKRRFGKVHGLETYFLQTTRSARSMRIAALENSVVLDKNDYLSNDVILQSVLSGPKIELSHKLAIDVQSNVLKDLRHKYKGVSDGGVKPAPFWVLVGAQMPSILVEVGYITNPIERRRLFSPDYQKRIAKGIAEGVSNYLRLREKEMY
jgi:N-acetylmuramoyl-L-alanine amidase